MPVLSQQEGTFTNINKKVVPTNAAIAYNGYTLNDIANEILEERKEYTVDYTSEIFNNIPFDDLENHYSNDQVEHRGYTIEPKDVETCEVEVKSSGTTLEVQESEYIIYNGNPINQFNEFTAVANQLKNDIVALYVSQNVKSKLEIEAGDQVTISSNGTNITLEVRVDETLTGDISYVPTFDRNMNTKELFDTCRFNTANIKKV
jgi:NADH-quinone oxidoreductase subunit G